jgi:hypothetical protein
MNSFILRSLKQAGLELEILLLQSPRCRCHHAHLEQILRVETQS